MKNLESDTDTLFHYFTDHNNNHNSIKRPMDEKRDVTPHKVSRFVMAIKQGSNYANPTNVIPVELFYPGLPPSTRKYIQDLPEHIKKNILNIAWCCNQLICDSYSKNNPRPFANSLRFFWGVNIYSQI